MLTIYKASAGSGKTYTLAKSYILLLIGIRQDKLLPDGSPSYTLNLRRDPAGNPFFINDNPHRAILAITFTRKATEEMKTRILAELEALSDITLDADEDKASKYAIDFKKDYGWDRQDMADAAKLALQKLLYDYHNFNVSTIDSFFQLVMRTFARELNFQSDYTVEIQDKPIMHAAVGSMLDEFNKSMAGENKTLEDWLTGVMIDKIKDANKTNLFNRRSSLYTNLVDLINHINEESFKDYAQQMEEYLGINEESAETRGKRVAAFSNIVEARCKQLKKEVVDLVKSTFGPDKIDPSALQVGSAKKVSDIIANLIDTERMPTSEEFIGSIGSNHGVQAFVRDVNDKTTVLSKNYSASEELAATDCLRKIGKKLFEYASLLAVKVSLLQLGTLANAWTFLKNLIKDNNLLLLSDTNHMLSSIIGDDETPFVYERMGVQLKHFLIDEFQDTSEMQWENLKPLVKNGLSEGGNSLVIGDEKQSIYRFRNSDSTILGTKVGKAFEKDKRDKGNIPAENTNYRSSPDVVKFNNTIFAIMSEATQVVGFDNVVQGINRKHSGFVKFTNVSKTIADPKGKPKKTSMTEEEILTEMAETIVRQISEGLYDQRDIAVLVNTRKEAGKVVEFLLKNYADKINVFSDEALYLVSSTAVRKVISVMKIMDEEQNVPNAVGTESKYPTRAEALLAMNRYSYFLSENGPSSDPEAQAQAMCRALGPDSADSVNLKASIDDIRDMKPASLLALVETIINFQLSDSERAHQGAYLAALQDIVLEFESKAVGSVHAFLDWWESHKDKLTLVGDANADGIKVMTVHKSKGLEFHCVHLPFCTWEYTIDFGKTKKPKMWIELPEAIKNSLAQTNPPDLEGCMPQTMHITFGKDASFEPSPFYPICSEEERKVKEDALNKTYVAFTRAKTELHAWYKNNTKDSINDIGVLISNAAKTGVAYASDPQKQSKYKDLLIDLRNCIDRDGNIIIGQETIKKRDDKEKESYESITLPYMVYDIGEKRRYLIPDLDDDKDDVAFDENGALPAQDPEARDFGVTMHKIMEKIRILGDIDSAVNFVARRRRLSRAETEECRDTAYAFMELDPELTEKWMRPSTHALTESAIYIPSNQYVRRPDLVIINDDDSVEVIDYKFTDNPEHVGLDAHIDQINEYASLLRDMHKFSRISTFICYPRCSVMLKGPKRQKDR